MNLIVLGKQELKKGIEFLSKSDKDLENLFSLFKIPTLKIEKNYFWSLCRSIIYQQISGKAANKISNRFLELFSSADNLLPKDVLECNAKFFRSVGLSKQKASYIKNVAIAFENNNIPFNDFPKMSDELIMNHLISIKGIGKWTAEMFLLFTMRRSDIFPVSDLGIQKGYKKLYNLDSLPDPGLIKNKTQKWKPYRSIVSLYLWHFVEGPFEW